jgi:excisionase family DNA binding protein
MGDVVIRPPLPKVGSGPVIVTVAEAARMLGLAPMHVRTMVERGELAAFDVGTTGKHFYRIPVEAINAWLDSRTVQAPDRETETAAG